MSSNLSSIPDYSFRKMLQKESLEFKAAVSSQKMLQKKLLDFNANLTEGSTVITQYLLNERSRYLLQTKLDEDMKRILKANQLLQKKLLDFNASFTAKANERSTGIGITQDRINEKSRYLLQTKLDTDTERIQILLDFNANFTATVNEERERIQKANEERKRIQKANEEKERIQKANEERERIQKANEERERIQNEEKERIQKANKEKERIQKANEETKRIHKAIQEWNQQIEKKMDEIESELSNIVGLEDLKLQLRTWAKGMLLDDKRRTVGLKVGARRPPHMAFLGSPGTGKTMIARILGKLMKMVGVLPTDKVIEVQRTDLVAEYIGQTGPKTRKKIDEAEGGILFVDEAYRLVAVLNSGCKDFGREALEEIMSVMDSGKVVVIFAGYSKEMKNVISCNEGFRRRVTKYFHFNDYNSEDLAKVLHLKMSKQVEESLFYGFKLHPSCSLDAVAALIENKTSAKMRKEMNGGLIQPLLINARENLDMRISLHCEDTNDLVTITLEDLDAGIKSLSTEETENTEANNIAEIKT